MKSPLFILTHNIVDMLLYRFIPQSVAVHESYRLITFRQNVADMLKLHIVYHERSSIANNKRHKFLRVTGSFDDVNVSLCPQIMTAFELHQLYSGYIRQG